MVEDLLRREKRVCVIDPKGDWYGLKLSADGKSSGFPVIAFGDFVEEKASDVPINEQSGRHIAELISSGNRPCVIGFRGWMPGRMTQFWIDFASTLFNSKSGELYLIIDECHNFMPKGKVLDPQAGKCLHWSNRILSEGRGLGLVILIASQRPQKVHNDALTCCETLFAMRVVHAADRAAIEDWIEGCGDKAQGAEVLKTIASQARGEANVWCPEHHFGPRRIQFPMFQTFDSFAPPQLQKKISAAGWAGVDLDAVKQKLAKVIEEAKANDPGELRKEIARLKTELARKPEARPAPPEKVPAVDESDLALVRDAMGLAQDVSARIIALEDFGTKVAGIRNELAKLNERLGDVRRGGAVQALRHAPAPRRALPTAASPRPRAAANGDVQLNSTQQRILNALMWLESVGVHNPTNLQVGAIALIDASGGHFGNVVGPLSTGGLINRGVGNMSLTDEGRKYAQMPEQLATLADYHAMLRDRVRRARNATGKTVEMLNAIIARGGEPVTTDTIGNEVGIDHTGGHFGNTIGPLGTIGLITRDRGLVTPTEILFPPGLA